MIDPNQASFEAVRKYLSQNFPDADSIPAPRDVEGAAPARIFSVEEGYDLTQLELRRAVYQNRTVAQLVALLEAHTVAETMQANPEQRLVIAPLANGGVRCSIEALRG